MDFYKPVILSNITIIRTLSTHKKAVNCLLKLIDERIASGSDDATIKIHNPQNDYNCDIIIKGHTNAITYISQIRKNKLVSSSRDKSIRIWNLISQTTYMCDHIIEGHSHWVWKVIILPNYQITSCSEDKTIKLWKGDPPYNLIQELIGHNKGVTTILHLRRKNKIISGSADKTLRIWNIITYQCEAIFKNVYSHLGNSILEISNSKVMVGGNNTISIINVINYKIEHSITNSSLNSGYALLKIRNDNILCGCYGRILIYNMRSNTIQIKNNAHNGDIYDFININRNQFASCSYDGTIKIWNY